jgi:hypothetical protein
MRHCTPRDPQRVPKPKYEATDTFDTFVFIGSQHLQHGMFHGMFVYEHEKVRRVLVPEWTARYKYRYYIIG